ncbi:MAG: metallophosphoesterase [Verrucomicrobiota bacterium]
MTSSRRAFIRNGSLFLAGAAGALLEPRALAADEKPVLRVGMLTDLHHADLEPKGTRYYRETLGKLRECIARFNEAKADFAIELGDYIDEAPTAELEAANVRAVEAEYAKFKGERHYVLGNHCVWTLTKQQFRDNCAARAEHYSFDKGGFHFVLLDACYRADGVPYGEKNFKWTDTEIPSPEREWLKADLESTNKKTIVCVHQRLDVQNQYGVKSAPQVRQILEESGKVLAVFQGHSHKNDYHEINGIHYCTLAAMIEGSGEENNAYGLLSVFADGALKLDGFRQQKSHAFAAKR